MSLVKKKMRNANEHQEKGTRKSLQDQIRGPIREKTTTTTNPDQNQQERGRNTPQ